MADVTETTRTCPNCGAINLPGSRFCSTCGQPMEASAPEAEIRKTVTILFCDATSSTTLGEQLDPESVRRLMTRYFAVMRQVIEFHGGTVEKFIGDAVMAVFGVPAAHEDDALRACRAAAEIRERLGAMDDQIRAERGASIEWRTGINTGEVVVGAITGQRLVTGDAVNVAARLEAAAAPGETLLGPTTFVLVRDAVVAEPLEPLTLKGKSEPMPAWRLISVSEDTRRQPRPLEAPLVGRRRPMRLLEEAFSEAAEERVCHLFTILGTAGVGKSRLVDEFLASAGDGGRVATGRCLAYGHGITFWPVAEAMREALDVAEDDAPGVVAARLRETLGAEPEAERIVSTMGALLGAEQGQAGTDETFWAIRKTFESLARATPLILVFDDVHWGEPTFLDLIDHITDWTRDAPILLVVMARPELLEERPGWGGGKRWVTTISLEPLSGGETEELVLTLLGRTELPSDLCSRISVASEGNPFFVEELLAKLIDDGFLVPSQDAWSVSDNAPALTIPGTIQALLAARLDGLTSEDRAVIERAAVEGKVFHRGAVTELAPDALRADVPARLASLMRMELVRPDNAAFAGDEAYRFRHLLIRDAAYQALAKQTRSELHERFAGWLERAAGDRRVEFQEIIGYHLEQAYRYRAELGPTDEAARALAARAGTLLAEAGERAERRDDAAATADLFGRAIELLPKAISRERRLAYRLGYALYDAGHGARAESVLSAAVAEADEAGDEGASALAAVGLLTVRTSTRAVGMEEALREYERLGAVLERTGDVAAAHLARAAAGFTHFGMGRAGEASRIATELLAVLSRDDVGYREARSLLGAALVFGPAPIADAVRRIEQYNQSSEGILFSGAPLMGIWRMRAWQGEVDEARERLASARHAFEELGNRHFIAANLGGEAEVAYLAGDLDAAERLALQGYEAQIAIGDLSYASTQAVLVSRTLLDRGDLDEAERFARIALETSAVDDVVSQAGGRSLRALVLSHRGEHQRAVELAREAEAVMAATDYLLQHGEAAEDLAMVLHAAGDQSAALEMAEAARALYESKGANAYVARIDRLIADWVS